MNTNTTNSIAAHASKKSASSTFHSEKTIPKGYRLTDVGVIPEDWEVRRFSDHFNIYAGGDVPKHSVSDTQSESHPYPIFANSLQNNGLYGYTNEERSKANSLTITARGYLGHAEYRGESFFPIVRLLVLEPINELDAKFTTYAVNCQVKFSIESTGVPQLTAPQVGMYFIASPKTLSEQRAIAAALSDVDALIAGLEALIAKKRHIKQGAMQELLTGQRRLDGFSGDWEVKRLGEVGIFLKGSGVKKDESLTGEIPCVRYGEIYTHHDNYIKKFNSFISAKVAKTATMIKKGDLLFAGSGETKSEIGKCVSFIDGYEAYAGGDIVILRPFNINPLFMGYYCNTPKIVAQKASKGQGDAVVHISSAALSDIQVALPPLPEQEAIARILSDMDDDIATLEARLDKTRALKQGMMQELLTGRVRLHQSITTA